MDGIKKKDGIIVFRLLRGFSVGPREMYPCVGWMKKNYTGQPHFGNIRTRTF